MRFAKNGPQVNPGDPTLEHAQCTTPYCQWDIEWCWKCANSLQRFPFIIVYHHNGAKGGLLAVYLCGEQWCQRINVHHLSEKS